MPPAARSAISSTASSSAVRPSSARIRRSLPLDLLDGQRPEGEALQARDDGGADVGRVGRAEDEQHVVGRLLERLEEDVPALLDALDLVDDEDLPAQVGRRGVDARQQLAHVVDLLFDAASISTTSRARPSRIDDAGRAGVAGLAVHDVGAVDRLGQDARHRGLARAARADEEEAMGEPVEADGVAERLDDHVLADDLVEASARASVDRAPCGGRRGGRRGGVLGTAAVKSARPAGSGRHCRATARAVDRGCRAEGELPCTLRRPKASAHPPWRSTRTRPVRGTRRSALIAASFRT